MLKKLLNLFNYNQQLVDKVEWKITDGANVLQWSKRGIANGGSDLKLRKGFCYFFIGALVLASLFLFVIPILSEANSSILYKLGFTFAVVLFLSPFVSIAYFGLLEVKYYTYRITEKELELVCWKENLLFCKQLALGLLFIITPFLVIVFIIMPEALLVSLGGMAGVGILAGATLFSKSYIESHLGYEHLLTRLDTIEQLQIDEPRKFILFIATNYNLKKPKNRVFNVFCTDENFNALVETITKQAAQNNVKAVYADAYTVIN